MLSRLATSFVFVALLGVSAVSIPNPKQVTQAASNQLVKASTAAVYYVGDDQKRYVFPNERIFNSWFKDFASVVTMSDTELASYPIGGAIFYRPGTRLVKITTDPKVYAPGPGGALHPIASEAAANQLYGTTWAQRVDDLPDAFFANYQISFALTGDAHPIGTYFRYTETNASYVLDYVENTLTARRLPGTLASVFKLNSSFALSFPSTAFPYSVGADWQAADTAAFLPHQPLARTPSAPDEESGGDTSTPSATVSMKVESYSKLKPSTNIVRNDDAARVYAFTLRGDKNETIAISGVKMRVYIDAGGSDSDFGLGSDDDGNTIFWPANQILNNLRLRDIDTGVFLTPAQTLDSSGELSFDLSLDLPANTVKNVELTTGVQTVVTTVRLSADISPVTDIEAVATLGQKPTIVAAANLNGGISPSITVKPAAFGSLVIDSTTTLGDSIYKLGQSLTPYTLTFTSNGEPFRISDFTIGVTALGDDIYVVDHIQAGTELETAVDSDLKRYSYINFDLEVPKNETVELPFLVSTLTDGSLYSDSRLQLKFLPNDFSADGLYSGLQYTSADFANQQKLDDNTSPGPLALFRQGSIAFVTHPQSPKLSVSRYNTIPVLTFNLTGKDHAASITKLTVRVDSSDIDKAGDDNDFFERVADTFANSVIKLAAHGPDIDDRNFFTPSSVSFAIYDNSTSTLDTTPTGLQTDAGDYGVFTLYFSGSALTVQPGQTLALDLDINTTLISSEHSENIRARLLKDLQSTDVSQANLLWNDGSNIITTGYLVGGLDLLGSTLDVL